MTDNIVERVARSLAGYYGPSFDDCMPTRRAVKDAALRGQANINDPNQEEHREAARAAILVTLRGLLSNERAWIIKDPIDRLAALIEELEFDG